MKLKICGMKLNVSEVAALRPDYLGFIFYNGSPRNFQKEIPTLPEGIEKVGVFVDATIEEISERTKKHHLDVIQLHGEETPEYCIQLREKLSNLSDSAKKPIELWKVFSIKDSFDFNKLIPYEKVVEKFLFDTKGKEKGGNGYAFDWKILQDYSCEKLIILSGGIGLDSIADLGEILSSELPVYAIDVNSKFELVPGLKQTTILKEFIKRLSEIRK